MKFMFNKYLILFLIISNVSVAQDYNWNLYNSDNSELPNQTIKSIAVDQSGAIWMATYMGGVAVLKDNEWTIYNTSNSELPHNYVNSVSIDKSNNVWIGTDGGGLAMFDRENWAIYKTSTSGIPSNVVMTTYCDDDGSVWVGTYFGGLAHFDKDLWTVYNDENSPLLSNKVVCIEKDTNNLLWIGTQGGGIAAFDRNAWNIYTERNSKLTSDFIYSIAIDHDNKKWIGTGGGGVVVFNDVYWVKYNTKNTIFTDDNIRPIGIDAKNNKWIGSYIGGLFKFDNEEWTIYDFNNSQLPDDEITCITYNNNKILVGTERSGLIEITDLNPINPTPIIPLVVEVEEKTTPAVVVPEIIVVAEVVTEEVVVEEIVPAETQIVEETIDEDSISAEAVAVPIVAVEVVKEKETNPTVGMATPTPQSRIVLMMDAADLYFDTKGQKQRQTIYAFKYLLKHRERINSTYDVQLLIYSSNYDVNPKKIIVSDKDKVAMQLSRIEYLEGESTFTEATKKAFNLIKLDYKPEGNNHVIAATHKYIRDDETAKIIIKENLDNHFIVFSLLAFKTKDWKLESKMRNMIPKSNGHYYSIEQPGIKDNWSITAQIGMSIFGGDVDVNKSLTFPGVFGITANKQLFSSGMINGGVNAQLNFGRLQGSKSNYSFKNNFWEGSLSFEVVMKRWFNQTFTWQKLRPYAYAGLGFISYRALLKDQNGNILNGVGYDVINDDIDYNGTDPEKTTRKTEMIFPIALGGRYKINDKIHLNLEMTTRYINSDQLDAKVAFKDDKYWLITVGATYKINTKQFTSDILRK